MDTTKIGILIIYGMMMFYFILFFFFISKYIHNVEHTKTACVSVKYFNAVLKNIKKNYIDPQSCLMKNLSFNFESIFLFLR